jgi:hypothetical protein
LVTIRTKQRLAVCTVIYKLRGEQPRQNYIDERGALVPSEPRKHLASIILDPVVNVVVPRLIPCDLLDQRISAKCSRLAEKASAFV